MVASAKGEYPLIYGAIVDAMADVDSIGKNRKNTGQGYSFRGIDDVYNSMHDVLSKHGIFTVPRVLEERYEERTSKSGSAQIYRVLKVEYKFCARDGSSVDAIVVGEGMDSGDKASNKAMSAAHKYALMQVFAIPTEDDKDSENDSHEVLPRHVVVKAAPIDAEKAEMVKLMKSLGREPKSHDEWKNNILQLTGLELTRENAGEILSRLQALHQEREEAKVGAI